MKAILEIFYKRDPQEPLITKFNYWPDYLIKWLGSILKKIKNIFKEK